MGMFEELLTDVLSDPDGGVSINFSSEWISGKVSGYAARDGSFDLSIRAIFHPTDAWNDNVENKNREYAQRILSNDRVTKQGAMAGFCRYSLDETGGALQVFVDGCSFTRLEHKVPPTILGIAMESPCPACADGVVIELDFYLTGDGYSLQMGLTDDNLVRYFEVTKAIKEEIERWRTNR